jgi:pSer/pThr/pTyr-binding forkhead associated (FHA) protein
VVVERARVLKLIIEDDEGRKTVVPFVRDEITIGRQEGNTIRLTERNVSRRHARLLRQSANVLIEDLGSYNGIRVNGDRITGQVQVQDGDLIQIGDYDLAIQQEEERAPPPTIPLDMPRSPQMAATVKLPDPAATLPALPTVSIPEARDEDVQDAKREELAGPPRQQSTAIIRIDQVAATRPQRSVVNIDPFDAPRLVVLNTDFAGKEFACVRTELKIGRTDDNDIVIDHRSLSRTHCKIVREDTGEWKVIDMQSANGIMVNGEPYAQVALRQGDVIELGHVKLRFVGPGEASHPSQPSGDLTVDVPQTSSRGPLIAIVIALLVLVAGGGGYAFLKSSTPVEVIQPSKKSAASSTSGAPSANSSLDETTEARNEQIMADADVAIAQGDFLAAEALLKQCKVGESVCPRAKALLTDLANEKSVLSSLEQAERAVASGDLDRAQTLLAVAKNTKLLRERFLKVEQARADALAVLINRGKSPTPPTPPVAPVQIDKQGTIEKLLRDAKDAKKLKQYQSAVTNLKRCLEIERNNPDCIVTLASVHAQRGSEENSNTDNEKARELYSLFLTIAPNDRRVPKVREILGLPK